MINFFDHDDETSELLRHLSQILIPFYEFYSDKHHNMTFDKFHEYKSTIINLTFI